MKAAVLPEVIYSELVLSHDKLEHAADDHEDGSEGVIHHRALECIIWVVFDRPEDQCQSSDDVCSNPSDADAKHHFAHVLLRKAADNRED